LGITIVVKVGGGVVHRVADFDAVLAVVAEASRRSALLVVPGGGRFADAVREMDQRLQLGDDAAHWMAVLGMDQYAYTIARRLAGATLVRESREILSALQDGRTPVLAPFQWLHEADPLPHSWDVTSDSIAAWVAGQVGAPRLVLVKPAGAAGPAIVDPCFERFLPPQIETTIVAADQIDRLRLALRQSD
jgi:dihydroneopterin aldolase